MHSTHLAAGQHLVSNPSLFEGQAGEKVWLNSGEKHAKAFPKEKTLRHFCHTYAFFSCDPQTGQVLAQKGDLVDGTRHQSQDTVAGARILADQAYRFRHEWDAVGPPFEVYCYSHVPFLAQVDQMGDICNEEHPRAITGKMRVKQNFPVSSHPIR